MTADARFRPQDRIRKRSEYQTIYDKGQRIPAPLFVLFVMRNAAGRARLGVTMTRRIGGAVKRNRAKRLVREVFRRHKTELMDVDIVVNGERRTLGDGATVRSLLADLSLPESRVAVERNREIVRKADFAGTALRDGDRVEIVTFVGGG